MKEISSSQGVPDHHRDPNACRLLDFVGCAQDTLCQGALLAASILGLLAALALLHQSCKKVLDIQKPDPLVPDAKQDTYCVLSLYIVALSQILLLCSLIQFAFTIVLASLPPISEATFRYLMLYGYRTIIYINYFLLFLTTYCQTIEWDVMRFLILYEKKMSIG